MNPLFYTVVVAVVAVALGWALNTTFHRWARAKFCFWCMRPVQALAALAEGAVFSICDECVASLFVSVDGDGALGRMRRESFSAGIDHGQGSGLEDGRRQMWNDLTGGGPIPEEGEGPGIEWLAMHNSLPEGVRDERVILYDPRELFPDRMVEFEALVSFNKSIQARSE